jgi:hypothetical protein
MIPGPIDPRIGDFFEMFNQTQLGMYRHPHVSIRNFILYTAKIAQWR